MKLWLGDKRELQVGKVHPRTNRSYRSHKNKLRMKATLQAKRTCYSKSEQSQPSSNNEVFYTIRNIVFAMQLKLFTLIINVYQISLLKIKTSVILNFEKTVEQYSFNICTSISKRHFRSSFSSFFRNIKVKIQYQNNICQVILNYISNYQLQTFPIHNGIKFIIIYFIQRLQNIDARFRRRGQNITSLQTQNQKMDPTTGFNVEILQLKHKRPITIWDIGGQEQKRNLWVHYLQNTQLVMYIIDSTD
ncbi:ADP-ribosylation_factor [Hexamita inflata]|uniref:ADP-ribosylation_factor n=1 Tax=Hexamita inflata TaxID=28002 RepID=A0ABP1H242_9EUKA